MPASASAGVRATAVGTFAAPTYIVAPPGDTHRLFVVQQSGQIEPIPGADTANAGSEHVLITIPHPNQSNHNGGQLQFGPDGDLYVSVGDGGGGNDTEQNAQRLNTLLGKILRISPQTSGYSIPAGNPFSGGPECSDAPSGGSTNCPEIWAYGLRNPWRFSFDGATGDMVIADVGQSAEQEIDFASAGQNVGANYGWPCYEGLERDPLAPGSECSPLPSSVVFPLLTYPHPQNCGTASFCGDGIIGGYVMHDPTLPSLDGCYVYGDLGTPGLSIVHLAEPFPSASVPLGPEIAGLSSFGLDASGHLYAADIANGDVYRIESDGNPATDPGCAAPAPPLVPPQQAPVNTSAPAIHGSPTPGAELTCTPGRWGGATSFAYEWLRDAAPLAAGANYRPRASDVGHLLSCQVTASNAAGSARAVSAAVSVRRPAPRLFSLRITPTVFRAAASGLSGHRERSRGGTVTFGLDERATVTFTVQRALSGREISGHCRLKTRSHPRATRCTIWGAVRGRFRVTGRRGTNRLTFIGRLGGHKLDPGHYRVVARPRDAAGSIGKSLRAQFSIRA